MWQAKMSTQTECEKEEKKNAKCRLETDLCIDSVIPFDGDV